MLQQYVITPTAGKRLIGKGMAAHPAVGRALSAGTLVIVAGTTNGYVAEEVLKGLGQAEGFSRRRFFRGLTLPSARPSAGSGRLADEGGFPGDVIIRDGRWLKGQTIFDVADALKEGDLILKGANALDLARSQAAILIGHPQAGTIGTALQAVVGRRVGLILPVGLEKRIPGDLERLARRLNAPTSQGPRLLPVVGEVFTEIEALELLTGVQAELVAAGGVAGAEGAVWLALEGRASQLDSAGKLLAKLAGEPAFAL